MDTYVIPLTYTYNTQVHCSKKLTSFCLALSRNSTEPDTPTTRRLPARRGWWTFTNGLQNSTHKESRRIASGSTKEPKSRPRQVQTLPRQKGPLRTYVGAWRVHLPELPAAENFSRGTSCFGKLHQTNSPTVWAVSSSKYRSKKRQNKVRPRRKYGEHKLHHKDTKPTRGKQPRRRKLWRVAGFLAQFQSVRSSN